MVSPKISAFIISMLVVSFFVASFGIIIAEGGQNYNKDTTNIEGNLSVYNRFDAINNRSEEIQNKTLSIKTQSNVIDVIGGYFSSAYNALIISKDSFVVFGEVTNEALESNFLGSSGALLITLIVTTVLILIFVGIFLSAIIKREL